MAKNSFSLLETILAICILTLLVSGFSKFTYTQQNNVIEIEQVSNDLLSPHPTLPYIQQSMGLIQNNGQLQLREGSTILKRTYESDNIQFIHYSLSNSSKQSVSSKVFQ